MLRASLALALFALPLSAQTTWYVDATATPPGDGSQANPYASLQTCFAAPATVDGDTVLVLPGTYVEDLDLVGKSLDVTSTAGSAQTVLQAATDTSTLRVAGVAAGRLEGFTVEGGMGTPDLDSAGGAVFCTGSTLELVGCTLGPSRSWRGGALALREGADVTLDACEVSGGRAFYGGGVHTEAGTSLLMLDCTVSFCGPLLGTSGGFLGGGLYLGGPAQLERCTIRNCGGTGTSSSSGGGMYVLSPTTLVECTISDNTSLNDGGGIWGSPSLRHCELTGNRSSTGGAAYGSADYEDCLIQGNEGVAFEGCGGGTAGGVYNGTLTRCRIEGNTARRNAGGAFVATLIDCEVIGNRVQHCSAALLGGDGGGLWGGTATGCLIEGNVVEVATTGISAGGGGAYSATLIDCTLRDNVVDGETSQAFPAIHGGGAFNCQLVRCTVEGNEVRAWTGASSPRGGGVSGGSATDCSIRGNRVTTAGPPNGYTLGGGAAGTTLAGCVVFGNEADHGGGAWDCDFDRCTVVGNTAHLGDGALSMRPLASGGNWGVRAVSNSISWGNVPDELIRGLGAITTSWSTVLGGYPGAGNLDADPRFWNQALGDLNLRAGSPCIDTGDSAEMDPDGSRLDQGALPFDAGYVGGPYVYCTAKTTSEGCTPAIGFSGSPTLSGPDDFVVNASQVVANQNGLVFWGLAPAEVPFMGGLRCVANPVVRTAVSNSGGAGACGGVLSFAFTQNYLASQGLTAGTRVFAQVWFRDPAQADGTGVGLSDALDFAVLP